ncbi:hypothetical protein, partial [Micromonospora sp. S-DT3-3-22]|uniref:hypothetical protein n=1 Tax=Micromonospora sp. S-DT3-3-22 TaxID=2755359 RepID=UPI001E3E4F56
PTELDLDSLRATVELADRASAIDAETATAPASPAGGTDPAPATGTRAGRADAAPTTSTSRAAGAAEEELS